MESEKKERYYEDECYSDLEKSDSYILSKKYDKIVKKFYTDSKEIKKPVRLKSQWTRIHDSVQEHFCSHVLINQATHLLPSNICALKQSAKQSWMLYKKRECERRKRLRRKIEREKNLEDIGCPSNILLSLVDTCEICKKMYLTVNLFWGVTLCDICYFNEEVIHEVIKQKTEELRRINFLKRRAQYVEMKKEMEDRERLEELEKCKQMYFSVENGVNASSSSSSSIVDKMKIESIIDNSDEDEKFVIYDDNSYNPFEETDYRTISTYQTPSSLSKEESKEEEEEEEKIREENENECADILVSMNELREYMPYNFLDDVDSSNFI